MTYKTPSQTQDNGSEIQKMKMKVAILKYLLKQNGKWFQVTYTYRSPLATSLVYQDRGMLEEVVKEFNGGYGIELHIDIRISNSEKAKVAVKSLDDQIRNYELSNKLNFMEEKWMKISGTMIY